MIDFYKHSLLSILGKEAGSMTEIEYQNRIIDKYNEYLEMLRAMKIEVDENPEKYKNKETYL